MVYLSAKTYQIIGYKEKNNDYLRKSIDLMEKSILLISQNEDTEISEITIQGEIAQCYISLKEIDKGIEDIKKIVDNFKKTNVIDDQEQLSNFVLNRFEKELFDAYLEENGYVKN